MNASATTMPVGKAPAHQTHRFALLLKREYWEHKGGFLWAPLVAGGISLLLTLMAIIVAEVAGRRAGDQTLNIDGEQFTINALDLGKLTQHLGPEEARQLADGIDLSLLMASSWPFIVLGFVLFFYCLGALYDERKDRSVLFWKSLPLSDRETVLSKVVSATLVAPAIATAAALVTMFGFLLLVSTFVLLHGGNPVELVWGPGSPLLLAGQLIVALPVYALWMLPTVGWLLLCSSWARSKPFLWAIMIPVFAGVIVSWFKLMGLFNLETLWFWKNIVARMLFSVAPLTWMDVARIENMDIDGPGAIRALFSPEAVYSTLLTPQLWIGAVAGAAMIFGAIHLRRHRELAD
jgi:ABC-2 type transport system permease protein